MANENESLPSGPGLESKPERSTAFETIELESNPANSSSSGSSTRKEVSPHPSSSTRLHSRIPTDIHASLPISDEKSAFQSKWAERFDESKGMLLVLGSEVFAAFMAATTRLLALGEPETGGQGMGTLQIMFARFSITLLLSTGYMWYAKVPHFPFGMKEVRGILVLRGFFGFAGIFGFYYSLRYLPLAEAITLSFMIPLSAALAYHLVLHEPFHRNQLFAGLVALFGIILIARPFSFIPGFNSSSSSEEGGRESSDGGEAVSTIQRISAIALGLLSVLFVAGALTTIRLIGTRAHTLISVNYYAGATSLISLIILVLPIFPNVNFRLPHSVREWLLLLGMGIAGFLTQTLLTMGLVRDKTSRATNVMYAEVVFALGLDWVIWGVVPDWVGWVGMGFVVGGTLWGVVSKGGSTAVRKGIEEEGESGGYRIVGDGEDEDEEGAVGGSGRNDDDGGSGEERGSLDGLVDEIDDNTDDDDRMRAKNRDEDR